MAPLRETFQTWMDEKESSKEAILASANNEIEYVIEPVIDRDNFKERRQFFLACDDQGLKNPRTLLLVAIRLCKGIFTPHYEECNFDLAINALEYIQDIEASRLFSLIAAGKRLGLTDANFDDVLAEDDNIGHFANSIAHEYPRCEEAFSACYIDLRVWIILSFLKAGDASEVEVLALINTLFSPDFKTQRFSFVTKGKIEFYRRNLYELYLETKADANVIEDCIAQICDSKFDDEDINPSFAIYSGWQATWSGLQRFLDVAIETIRFANQATLENLSTSSHLALVKRNDQPSHSQSHSSSLSTTDTTLALTMEPHNHARDERLSQYFLIHGNLFTHPLALEVMEGYARTVELQSQQLETNRKELSEQAAELKQHKYLLAQYESIMEDQQNMLHEEMLKARARMSTAEREAKDAEEARKTEWIRRSVIRRNRSVIERNEQERQNWEKRRASNAHRLSLGLPAEDPAGPTPWGRSSRVPRTGNPPVKPTATGRKSLQFAPPDAYLIAKHARHESVEHEAALDYIARFKRRSILAAEGRPNLISEAPELQASTGEPAGESAQQSSHRYGKMRENAVNNQQEYASPYSRVQHQSTTYEPELYSTRTFEHEVTLDAPQPVHGRARGVVARNNLIARDPVAESRRPTPQQHDETLALLIGSSVPDTTNLVDRALESFESRARFEQLHIDDEDDQSEISPADRDFQHPYMTQQAPLSNTPFMGSSNLGFSKIQSSFGGPSAVSSRMPNTLIKTSLEINSGAGDSSPTSATDLYDRNMGIEPLSPEEAVRGPKPPRALPRLKPRAEVSAFAREQQTMPSAAVNYNQLFNGRGTDLQSEVESNRSAFNLREILEQGPPQDPFESTTNKPASKNATDPSKGGKKKSGLGLLFSRKPAGTELFSATDSSLGNSTTGVSLTPEQIESLRQLNTGGSLRLRSRISGRPLMLHELDPKTRAALASLNQGLIEEEEEDPKLSKASNQGGLLVGSRRRVSESSNNRPRTSSSQDGLRIRNKLKKQRSSQSFKNDENEMDRFSKSAPIGYPKTPKTPSKSRVTPDVQKSKFSFSTFKKSTKPSEDEDLVQDDEDALESFSELSRPLGYRWNSSLQTETPEQTLDLDRIRKMSIDAALAARLEKEENAKMELAKRDENFILSKVDTQQSTNSKNRTPRSLVSSPNKSISRLERTVQTLFSGYSPDRQVHALPTYLVTPVMAAPSASFQSSSGQNTQTTPTHTGPSRAAHSSQGSNSAHKNSRDNKTPFSSPLSKK